MTGSISTTTGLISGIDISSLTNSLIDAQRGPIVRLQNRSTGYSSVQTALKTLEANVLTLGSSIQQFQSESRFETLSLDNSDSTQLSASTNSSAVPGTYYFQSLRLASTYADLSKGFANADTQTIGTGTITIASGGGLHQSTLLDSLNGGNGVQRGSIRITDRSGSSADIDLSNTYSIDDVLDEINQTSSISVTASTQDGKIVLTDTSGSTASNLIVAEVNNGSVAEDLGIDQSVAADELTGDSVFYVTGDFTLDQINDGNGLYRLTGAPDLRITLTDDSTIDVNLDDIATINGVIDAINDHEDNGGKVTASLVDGHLELSDLSGGGGSSDFSIENINNTAVVRQLGLDVTASGTQITGRNLMADFNSVLLQNLRGGQGITQTGEISLTDRAGITATIDLTDAQSLDEVLTAINEAEDGSNNKLQLTAQINAQGTGIEILDTSGSTTSNLIIADVGGSTLSDDLGITVDAAQTSIDSGSLAQRYINEATSISDYAPDGEAVEEGTFKITDSAGNSAIVDITDAVETIGDVLVRINAASGISVSAELNETGDGIVLIDEAAGSEALIVEETSGNTAADLRLLGTGVLEDGKYRIESRRVTSVDVESTDTLNDIVEKLNDVGGLVTASIFDDGSAFNSTRLSLVSKASGAASQLFIDDGNLDLQLETVNEARDALLRTGNNTASGFIIASDNNTFSNAQAGIDVTILNPSETTAEITVTRDDSPIVTAIQTFVSSYNSFIDQAAELTKYDAETNQRGILQGEGIVLRITNRLNSLVTNRLFGSSTEIQSMIDVGVRVGTGGKLVFNQDQLESALENNHEQVKDFFQTAETGFADKLDAVFESITDPFTGTITLRNNSLQSSIDDLQNRITQLDEILAAKRERLFLQFVQMEETLSQLQAQQQTLGAISSLQISAVGTGIL